MCRCLIWGPNLILLYGIFLPMIEASSRSLLPGFVLSKPQDPMAYPISTLSTVTTHKAGPPPKMT